MTFDQLYPDAPQETEINFEGACMVKYGAPIPCWHCKSETSWLDLSFLTALCSEECSRIKWAEYKAAFNGQDYLISTELSFIRRSHG